jgi:hypothetical protein
MQSAAQTGSRPGSHTEVVDKQKPEQRRRASWLGLMISRQIKAQTEGGREKGEESTTEIGSVD